jgi:hypothetical protein
MKPSLSKIVVNVPAFLLLTMTSVVFFTLPFCGDPFCADDGALGQEKKPLEKVPPAEIKKLINQLGDDNFAVRARASRQLAQIPGALVTLRHFLKDGDHERRKRAQILVDQLTRKNLKSLLREIVKRKQKAPLDLLTDLVAEHKDKLEEQDWKEIFATIGAFQKYVLRDSKAKTSLSDPNAKFSSYPLFNGEMLTRRTQLQFHKIAGDRVMFSDLHGGAVFASGSINPCTLGGCIVLTNGGMAFGDSSAILASFVFSDQDVSCETALGSLIVARGCVKAKTIENNVIIEGADKTGIVDFFSTRFFGLTLVLKGEDIHVVAVAANSTAAKNGFRIGDVILFEAKKKTLESLDKAIRQQLAKTLELELRVSRPGGEQMLFLSFLD